MNNSDILFTINLIIFALLIIATFLSITRGYERDEWKKMYENVEKQRDDLQKSHNNLYNRLAAESSKRTFLVTEERVYSVQDAANEFKKIVDLKQKDPYYTNDLEKISLLAALCNINKDTEIFNKARLNEQLQGDNKIFVLIASDIINTGKYIDTYFMWHLDMKYWDMFECETLPHIYSNWSVQEDISHLHQIFESFKQGGN